MRHTLFSILVLFSFSTSCLAHDKDVGPDIGTQDCHSSLVEAKRDYYHRVYPDILFVILKGGVETTEEMMVLDTLLGPEPMSMDYEHPEDLREELMDVSAQRILLLLQHRLPSAALFKADNPLGWQENICTITFDPCAMASSDLAVTAFLLDFPIEKIRKIPAKHRLDKKDYIELTIDHEVYHCLKSMYVGPQTMSSHRLWGEYNHYLNEKAADVFALAMHIRKYKRVTQFAKNYRLIRGMALLNADPNHHTDDALKQLLEIPASELEKMTDAEVFDLANSIKDDLTISYDEYLGYLAAAIKAIKILGSETHELDELKAKVKGVKVDLGLVQKLIESSRLYFAEWQGEKGQQE